MNSVRLHDPTQHGASLSDLEQILFYANLQLDVEPLNIIIAIDSSGSMSSEWNTTKIAIREIINRIEIGKSCRVGIVTFDTNATVVLMPSERRLDVELALSSTLHFSIIETIIAGW